MPGELTTRSNKTNHGRCLVSILTFYPGFEKCNYSGNVIQVQTEACMPGFLGALAVATALHFRGLRNGVARGEFSVRHVEGTLSMRTFDWGGEGKPQRGLKNKTLELWTKDYKSCIGGVSSSSAQ